MDASADAGKNGRIINRYCAALMKEVTIKVKRFDSYLRLLLMANAAIITMNMYPLAIMRPVRVFLLMEMIFYHY